MYKIIDTKLVRTRDNANIPEDPANLDYQEYLAWIDQGGILEPPDLDYEIVDGKINIIDYSIITNYTAAVQKILDLKAMEYGFDTISSAATYADEPIVAKFQEDGRKLRAWRSLVWAYTYTKLEEVKNGLSPIPTVDQFIATIPEFPSE
jgi:hypothetical protein